MKLVIFILLATVGAVVAIAVQLPVPTEWWLNSQQGVTWMMPTLMALAALLGLTFSWPLQKHHVAYLVALWLGANVGFGVMFVRLIAREGRLGNLGPIPLLVGAGFTAIFMTTPALAGALLANFLRRQHV